MTEYIMYLYYSQYTRTYYAVMHEDPPQLYYVASLSVYIGIGDVHLSLRTVDPFPIPPVAYNTLVYSLRHCD